MFLLLLLLIIWGLPENAFGSGGSGVSQSLLECIREGKCGLSSLCRFDFPKRFTCESTNIVNCIETTTTTTTTTTTPTTTAAPHPISFKNSKSLYGHLFLLSNSISKPNNYSWDTVVEGTDGDDIFPFDIIPQLPAHEFRLPPNSFVYVNVGSHNKEKHKTVRLTVGATETVDTVTSNQRECSKIEACRYLQKVCFGLSSFIAFPRDLQKRTQFERAIAIDCMEYALSCDFFANTEDVKYAIDSKNHINNNDGDGDDSAYAGLDAERILKLEKETNVCIVDCIWDRYPPILLPDKGVGEDSIDSVDLLRRMRLGLTTDIEDCAEDEIVFNDRINIYHTAADDNLEKILSGEQLADPDGSYLSYYKYIKGEGDRKHDKAAIISLSLVLVAVFLALVFVVYKRWRENGGTAGGFVHNIRGTGGSGGGYNEDDDAGQAIML